MIKPFSQLSELSQETITLWACVPASPRRYYLDRHAVMKTIRKVASDMANGPQLGTINASYAVIAAIPSSPDEYVVTCEDTRNTGDFVTWRTWAHDGYASYSNGHYFYAQHHDSPAQAKQAALRDMVNRAGYDAYELVSD